MHKKRMLIYLQSKINLTKMCNVKHTSPKFFFKNQKKREERNYRSKNHFRSVPFCVCLYEHLEIFINLEFIYIDKMYVLVMYENQQFFLTFLFTSRVSLSCFNFIFSLF